jgi:inorganic pyrophosphatase
MDIAKILAARTPPYDVNVVVEIPQGSALVKYEFDKPSGTIFVDRFLHTAMFYHSCHGGVALTAARSFSQRATPCSTSLAPDASYRSA